MPSYPSIEVNKNDKFFVALCVRTDLPPVRHTFISLGVERSDGTKMMLGAFGKVLPRGNSKLKFALTGSSSGKIVNERIFFDGSVKKTLLLSYKGYALTYEHYLKFLEYLTHLSINQNSEPLEAYRLQNEDAEGKVTLAWQGLHTLPDKAENRTRGKSTIPFEVSNNCRHTAIRFTKKATSLPKLGNGISSFFGKHPPLSATTDCFTLGSQNEHIYILPLSPYSFHGIIGTQKAIMLKLYKRLDNLIMKKHNDPLTKEKFNKITALYESIIKHEQADLQPLFTEINNWVNTNEKLMDSHREHHWVSFKTSTRIVFDEIKTMENDLGMVLSPVLAKA